MTWIIALLREVAYALVNASSQFEAAVSNMPGARLTSKMRGASHLAGDKASQLGKDATTLSTLGTMPADPASHPYQLARRDILAVVDDTA
jgi:hypothetical protein